MPVMKIFFLLLFLMVPLSSYSATAITVNDITNNRIYQRIMGGTTGSIPVSGTYTGDAPSNVQCQVIDASTHNAVLSWATVTGATIAGGKWSGILDNIPQGGMYHIQARDGSKSSVTDTDYINSWGMGILILLIGQSNGVFMYYPNECLDSGADYSANAKLHYFDGSYWTQPTTDSNGAITLGNKLISSLDIPVGIITKAVGSAPLVTSYDATGFLNYTSPTYTRNAIYNNAIMAVKNAGGSVEYVLWVGSEYDAGSGYDDNGLTVYANGLNALWSFLTSDIHSNIKLIFNIIGRIADDGNANLHCNLGELTDCQGWGPIKLATIKFINAHKNVYLGNDATGFAIGSHKVHYTPSGYTAMGKCFAQTILKILGQTTYYRGPHITGITKVDSNNVDVTIAHRGGTDFTPSNSITGFQLFDDGTEETIMAGVKKNATSIRLTTRGSLDGTIILKYMMKSNPTISGLVKDNTPLALPLEPYDSSYNVGTAWDEGSSSTTTTAPDTP